MEGQHRRDAGKEGARRGGADARPAADPVEPGPRRGSVEDVHRPRGVRRHGQRLELLLDGGERSGVRRPVGDLPEAVGGGEDAAAELAAE